MSVGRPQLYFPNTQVCVDTTKATTRLQAASDRRRIVEAIIASGGRSSVAELEELFGEHTQPKVAGLVRAGWLTICEDGGKEE